MSTEAWSPEDEPVTREVGLAYERFLRVLNREEGGKVPEALARKYLNVLLDPAFAKKHARTHARMLERYHAMMQKDQHMAIAKGLIEKAEDKPPPPWQIHIHRAEDAASIGATPGPVVDPSLGKNQIAGDDDEDEREEETPCSA